MANQLALEHICVDIDGTRIIDDVSFSLEPGDIGCLLGPSGCGKTTLLRTIGGFQAPSAGSLSIAGEAVASAERQASPEERRVGMVFQDLALFPHMSVRRNVAFGISTQPRKTIDARVNELLELVGMQNFADAYPHQLSGGQQQRVALIRAMAPRPPVLLLDEPFSSQDTERRVQLAHEVREILKRDGITAVLVTHDQYEAFAIADHIGVVSQGRLRQWDDAYSLYHTPADRFVADFIGEGVFLCGNTLDDNVIQTELGTIHGELSEDVPPGRLIELLVRPDDIIHDDNSPNKATVVARDFRGADHLYTLRMPGNTRLLCLAPSHHNHPVGEQFGIRLQLDHLVIFDRQEDVA
ncbi:ABC transporter ATP-binding protein [Granulosicoccus sp. 3-233]|uniref:ABC transporter ATP-binding protein n=1 Tax=Granulosicoccus sp. 3-233 TaxID=3417969 RepID=UPI003D355463